MTFVNHYGKWVDSEEPVTGVLNNNQVNWEWIDDGHCLTCDEAGDEEEQRLRALYMDEEEIDDEMQDFFDGLECDGSHTKLLGNWHQTNGLWEHNPEGEWAAIGRESTIQVVWSKTTTRGALCSPCYPGQVDLGSKGEFLAFTLPDELLYKED